MTISIKKSIPKHINQQGQSLVEVIIALGIATIIVLAFTNATISAVRNAQYAKNQNQATKLAQQSQEIIRAIRDQDKEISSTQIWSDLWTINLKTQPNPDYPANRYTGICYKLDKANFTLAPIATSSSCVDNATEEKVDTVFYRKINITDDGTNLDKKIVTVKVYWIDNKGTHDAEVTTYLTKWK